MNIIDCNDINFESLHEEFTNMNAKNIYYSNLMRKYDREYFKVKIIDDHSFLILDGKNVIGYVPLYIFEKKGKKQYSYDDAPLQAPLIDRNYYINENKIYEYVFNYIEQKAKSNNIDFHNMIVDPIETKKGIILYNNAIDYGYRDIYGFFALLIDLKEKRENIWNKIRKSYKPLINKTMKYVDVTLLDSKFCSPTLFDEYYHLHSSKYNSPRSKSTYSIQYEMIKKDQAFLVLISYKGNTIGALYFFVINGVVFYGSASIKDTQIDFLKGTGHFGLWTAILHSLNKYEYFHIGYGRIKSVESSKKLDNIIFFKEGFGAQKVISFRSEKYF